MMDWVSLLEIGPAKRHFIFLSYWILNAAPSGWFPIDAVHTVQDLKLWHDLAVTCFRLLLAGLLGVTAPGTASVSNRRICLHSPHHSEMSALSLAVSPSLSFILTPTAPSSPALHKRQVSFFIPSLIGCSVAMHAPPVLPAIAWGPRNS